MENRLRYYETPEDYKIFFKDGVTEEAADRAIRYAMLRGYGIIDQLIQDKYYFGMHPIVYKTTKTMKEQERMFKYGKYDPFAYLEELYVNEHKQYPKSFKEWFKHEK